MINDVIPIGSGVWIYIKAIKIADVANPTMILFRLSFKSFL